MKPGSKNIAFLTGLFVFYLFISPAGSVVRATVVINEIYPKTDPPANEWIELFNNGAEAVSLDRWKLQNAGGTAFTLNASSIIQPNNFLTFDQPQTGISFNVEGDTLGLFDENNALKDSQSFPGTLGWNTSVGRSVDGAGVWTVCDLKSWTKNKPNVCPPPPTPLATNTPTITVTPVPPTPIPTLPPDPTTGPVSVIAIPEYKTPISINNPGMIPAVKGISSESGTSQSSDQVKFILAGLFIGIGLAAFIAIVVGLIGKFRRKRTV